MAAALADNTLLPSVISFDNANVAFLGHLESGSSVINTTEGRELSMDVSVRELTPIPTCWIVHSNFLKPGYLGRLAGHDFPPKLLQKKHTFCLFRVKEFCSFCNWEQNEQNSIPFIPKTECVQEERDHCPFRVFLFRNSPKRTRPKYVQRKSSEQHSETVLVNLHRRVSTITTHQNKFVFLIRLK